MRNLDTFSNPYGDGKVIDSCGLFGMMSLEGRTFPGSDAIRAMANMHARGNGLGGGFAAYGIYPDFADCYALHVMFDSAAGRDATEARIADTCEVVHDEAIPTKPTACTGPSPVLRRYFIRPKADPRDRCQAARRLRKSLATAAGADDVIAADDTTTDCATGSVTDAATVVVDPLAGSLPGVTPSGQRDEEADERIIALVMAVNLQIDGAFVLSCGKNMGVFKGVGYPEDIGRFFRLDEYEGYLWTAHGRFPTNTQGWWGGAHPFSLLDFTVVHNGEISSYGTNRGFLETQGYRCGLHTDTEVIAYAVDLLARRHRLPMWLVAKVLAPPFWSSIDRMDDAERQLCSALRVTYPDLLMNGPFTVIIASGDMMMGLRDRVELRPLVAATSGDMLYLSSEEAPIRLVNPDLDRVWVPRGGEAVIGRVGAKDVVTGTGRGPVRRPGSADLGPGRVQEGTGRTQREWMIGAG